MKYLLLAAVIFALNSCNTLIGVYRDGKQAFEWTKGKFQGGGAHDEDLPIY